MLNYEDGKSAVS